MNNKDELVIEFLRLAHEKGMDFKYSEAVAFVEGFTGLLEVVIEFADTLKKSLFDSIDYNPVGFVMRNQLGKEQIYRII